MKIAIAGGTGLIGKMAVEELTNLGHIPLILSRGTGVDLMEAESVLSALAGVDAVIDVVSIEVNSVDENVNFFGTISRNLLAAEQANGVDHHVALTIVNTKDLVAIPHYAGKQAQEDTVTSGPIPWTLLPATQFHEFIQQNYEWANQQLPSDEVLLNKVQSVSGREVAKELVALALGEARGRRPDFAGPEVSSMAHLTKIYLETIGKLTKQGADRLSTLLETGCFSSSWLPKGPVDLGRITFQEWLQGQD